MVASPLITSVGKVMNKTIAISILAITVLFAGCSIDRHLQDEKRAIHETKIYFKAHGGKIEDFSILFDRNSSVKSRLKDARVAIRTVWTDLEKAGQGDRTDFMSEMSMMLGVMLSHATEEE